MKILHWKRDEPVHDEFPPKPEPPKAGRRQYDSAMSQSDNVPTKPITSPKSITQLARILDTTADEIHKIAHTVLGITRKDGPNRKLILSTAQCMDLLTAMNLRMTGRKKTGRGESRSGTSADATSRSRKKTAGKSGTSQNRSRKDTAANLPDLTFPKLRHRLDIHPEVSDRLSGWPHLHRRLGIMLQHLAANGRSTVVKGCRNDNKGWRRSPLGGNNGMQWYLWWTPASGAAATGLDAPEDAILIRDVRQHDDHSTLKAGKAGDYLTITQADELIEDIAAAPWTDEQKDFIDGRQPVRIIIGRPGSGKTTALWKAIETRAGERVLYLTWSPKLAEHARNHLASFAATEVEVVARDFNTFLGEMSGTDVPKQTLAESRAKFNDVIRRTGRDMGPWVRRPDALHGELRGMYFGRAGAPGTDEHDESPILHVDDDEYTMLRDHHGGVGEKAAKILLRIAQALLRDHDNLREIYPELAAATTALRRIRSGALPDGFDHFDRIVIDESQDLTMLESTVVIELAKALEQRQQQRPMLLMAGDAGQTVRPTGFEWSPLVKLLKDSLQKPQIVHLDEHLRCPRAIAEVVDRAAEWYSQIEKDARPTKQRRQTSAEHVDAQILLVMPPSEQEAVQLLNDLHDIEGVAIINPAHETPSWIPPEHRRRILDPAEAKGLEYQTVCVIDVANLLLKMKPDNLAFGTNEDLGQAAKRTAIDHLRVTLSRATETLLFLDVSPSAGAVNEMNHLVRRGIPYTAREAVNHLRHSEMSTEERVLARIDEARSLIETSTMLACERASQAVQLLGDADLPNGVPDIDIRTAAGFTMLEVTAMQTVTGMDMTNPETGETMLSIADRTIDEIVHSRARRLGDADDPEDEPGSKAELEAYKADSETSEGASASPRIMNQVLGDQHGNTFVALIRWAQNKSPLTAMLFLSDAQRIDKREKPNGHWFRSAIRTQAQEMRNQMEKGTEIPDIACTMHVGDVAKWLELTGYAGDAAARARILTGQAFDTVLKTPAGTETARDRTNRLEDAASLLRTLENDRMRDGRLLEAKNEPDEAIKAYKEADRPKDVLRILRNEGRWEDGGKLASGEIKADLEWLIKLDALVAERPDNQNRRLRNGERDRLERLLDKIQKRPSRKTTASSRTT